MLLAGAAISALPLFASESKHPDEVNDELLRFNTEARIDFQWDDIDGHTDNSQTGFKARYLVFQADGRIVPGLTYSWRQRLNRAHKDEGFFDATDWIYLNYDLKKWHFQAGKEVVAIGGWEYDRAPINLFGCSLFWNNIPCYELGVSAGYDITANDRLTAQITQSPFFTPDNRNMYAYNIMWNGSHGIFEAIYSANVIEYAKGHYINYIAFGNKFKFTPQWTLEVDVMNRAAAHQSVLFKDCSVMAEASYMPNDKWRIHLKGTYDVNKSGTDADATVLDGTDLGMIGGGAEFWPLRKGRHELRLHANAYYSFGKNTNPNDLMQKNTFFMSVGLTWNMNLLNIARKK